MSKNIKEIMIALDKVLTTTVWVNADRQIVSLSDELHIGKNNAPRSIEDLSRAALIGAYVSLQIRTDNLLPQKLLKRLHLHCVSKKWFLQKPKRLWMLLKQKMCQQIVWQHNTVSVYRKEGSPATDYFCGGTFYRLRFNIRTSSNSGCFVKISDIYGHIDITLRCCSRASVIIS